MTDSNATEFETIIEALTALVSAIAWTMPNDAKSVRNHLNDAWTAIDKLKEMVSDD